jgi:hypothetical protein
MRNWIRHWWSSRSTLSAYLDLELDRAAHRKTWRHLQRCADCCEELNEMSELRDELSQVPVPAVPRDLAFNVRLRVAQERYRAQQPNFWWRLRTRFQPFAMPAFSGTMMALLIFALFIPEVAIPGTVYKNDIPIAWATPARLRGTGPVDLGPDPEDLVVQILIDHHGRVADYSILAGKYTRHDVRELRNRLTFTVFDPATFHGRPTTELRLIAFSKVRVRG